jgi:hypothetical protein
MNAAPIAQDRMIGTSADCFALILMDLERSMRHI